MSEHWIDRAWKDIIKGDPDGAISFFVPSIASARDFSQALEAADPIHLAIGGKSDKWANISDVCLKVPLERGEYLRSLFLIEQHHGESKDIPLRVFQSWYRASDEYQFPVTALVIYTGNAKPLNAYSREWHGTSVNFKFNTYSVPNDADVEELKRDERAFSIPVLAAKRMLDANGDPLKRGEYSLELLDLIKKRGLDYKKAWLYRQFTSRILQTDAEDIESKIKEVWKMQFRPIEEVQKEIFMRYAREEAHEEAKEEGKVEGKVEMARNLLKDGVAPEIIARSAGLPLEKIQALQN